MEALQSPREAMKRERAGALVQSALDRRYLPGYLPGEPSTMAATVAASRLAPAFLEELAVIYGVRRWTREAFREAFVEGALEGWRPGQRVSETRDALRIVAQTCPLAAENEADPRTCQMCRAFQREVALRADPNAIDVRFDELITRGDAACEITITMARTKEAPA